MNDPINEIFNGTPDGIDEDELKRMQQQEAINAAAVETAEKQMQEEKESSSSTTTESQPKQETQPTATAEEPKEEKEEGFDLGRKSMDTLEQSFAFGVGSLDFGVDVINLIPGVDAPKLPKFHSDTAQLTRELFSVVGPTIGLTSVGQTQLAGAANATKLQAARPILLDPFVKWLGKTLWAGGAGAFVDGVSSTSEGDNLSGVLKQNFPRTYAWIPDNIATLDTDSPDTKRIKNVNEGLGLGAFGDVLGGFIQLVRNEQGVRAAFRWIPENEKAKNWFKKNAPEVDEDVINAGAAKRSDALDELGAYNFEKSQNLDEPILGVHDLYGYEESGIRSTDDMGIIGAAVDQARIQNNLDTTYGRLGSVTSDPVIKYAIQGVEEYEAVMYGLREVHSDAGEYGYRLTSGKMINSHTIKDAGQRLADQLGYMNNVELEKQLEKFKTGIDADTGAPTMSSEGMAAVKFSIVNTMQELSAVGDGVAHALTRVSLAGQVSDMAQGMRYSEGSSGYTRSKEQILDRLEMLMIANGETGKHRGLFLKLMDVFRKTRRVLTPDELRDKGADTMKQIKAEAKRVRDTFEYLSENNPPMFKALMLAYEASDGNIRTIDRLNNYMKNSLGVMNKAFFDPNPETPSLILQSFWANVFNSVLSAAGTPIKAGASMAALYIEKPVAYFAGALILWDKDLLKKGLYSYSGLWEALGRGSKYFGESLRRSAIDPAYTGGTGRESMIIRDQKQRKIVEMAAMAKAEQGEYGPLYMLDQLKAMDDLANHPKLRLGNRLMQAEDGMGQAMQATLEARNRAWDMVYQGKVDADVMDQMAKKTYEQMWKKDSQGREILSDTAVKYAAGEIAFNIDSGLNDGISSFIRYVPAVKPFLMFTRTPIGGMKFMMSHSPLSLAIRSFYEFSQDFDEIGGEAAEQILKKRGIAVEGLDQVRSKYREIQAEMLGRKAIGTIAVGLTTALMLQDRLTGDGLYDKEKQRVRSDAGWKKRSIKGLDGKYYSYEILGPGIADWIAFTANVMDNFDVLGEENVGQYLHASAFVLAATFTDKSFLAGIEPMYDILNGNGSAINRWASSFLPSAVMPGASLMAEIGRVMSPNLRVVEEDLFSMIANRTPLKATLPEQIDYIYGDKVNDFEATIGGFMRRLVHTYTPFKIGDGTRPEAQFLIDVEFDMRPSMKTDGRGVDLTIDEQARVYEEMGKQKIYLREIRKIMKTADAEEFRRKFKEYSRKGGTPKLQDFENIHYQLRQALNKAKAFAIAEINKTSDYAIGRRGQQNNIKQQQDRFGNLFIPTR